jgi:predicted transcriptional regulator
MQIRNIMTKAVHVCHPEDSLANAAALMWKSDSDCLPVVDWQDRMVGQVTAQDLKGALDTSKRAAPDVEVSEAMSHNLVSCSPEHDIRDAIDHAEIGFTALACDR